MTPVPGDTRIDTKKAPRKILPSTLAAPASTESPRKVKHAKSRHGCSTCKAKRRKCDEQKPSCVQCTRRKLVCGGYHKEITFRFERPETTNKNEDARITDKQQATDPTDSAPNPLDGNKDIGSDESLDQPLASFIEADETESMEVVPSPLGQDVGVGSMQTPGSMAEWALNLSFSPSEQAADFDTFFFHLRDNLELSRHSPIPKPSLNGRQSQDPTPTTGSVLEDGFLMDLLSGTGNGAISPMDQVHYGPEPIGLASPCKGGSPSLHLPETPFSFSDGSNLLTLYRQPVISDDSPESIAILYNNRTCEVLSIKEDPIGNPWRKVVWPLAQKHPALYHAVAAMTCFNGARSLPQLRVQGAKHLESSVIKLSQGLEGNMRLEVALITTLTLSIAQTWYYPRASNGINHINKAKNMLQEALAHGKDPQQLEGGLKLGFLANLWLYMDVLTRVTCSSVQNMDLDFMNACTFTPSGVSGFQIDPLMGCARTLFPLIGRVADLVHRVRKSSNKLNSPTIVSRALELKMEVEKWAPDENLQAPLDTDSLTPSDSDLIQTANAHKWATLLLLYQAVPELPIRFSFSEVAQRILVYIATIPLTSRAVIFLILPLMIAGCEATDAEDREWVSDRWQSMIMGNSSGIVERCLEVTREVWKRRDGEESRCETCSRLPTGLELGVLTENGCGTGFQCSHGGSFNSVPFVYQGQIKAGCAENIVKSKYHWLSVMNEWAWEVMLG